MTILITGAAGYIGSHIQKLLTNFQFPSIGYDNLHKGLVSNTSAPCYIGDIRDRVSLRKVFKIYKPDVVFHLAALTSVPESQKHKDEYLEVNTEGTEILLSVMKEFNCDKLIFSSTASVYKQSNQPIKENDPIQILNNYALSKYYAERIIQKQDWLKAVIFRYFNVIGFGEWYDYTADINKTNIVPSLMRTVITGEPFVIYGNGYPVKRDNPNDHTCVRDYIDVRDIVNAHVKALEYLSKIDSNTKVLFNLGTKKGSSVLELVNTFCKVNDVTIEQHIDKPRKGDPASLIADSSKAEQLLYWTPEYSLNESLKISQ